MSGAEALVECPVIVGTAGHVDHGKSALIEALTGKNPDRLEVERRRGMTVELGFGELALPSGKIVGLVDVPGHAHYLRAMVQGATGIDVAVLVVSAVEGVMPQTREHVHVLELLGVTLDDDRKRALLGDVKALGIQKERALTDEEFLALLRNYQ